MFVQSYTSIFFFKRSCVQEALNALQIRKNKLPYSFSFFSSSSSSLLFSALTLPPHPSSESIRLSFSSVCSNILFIFFLQCNGLLFMRLLITCSSVIPHLFQFSATSSMDRLGCSPLILGWYSKQIRKRLKEASQVYWDPWTSLFLLEERYKFSFLFHNGPCPPFPCLLIFLSV